MNFRYKLNLADHMKAKDTLKRIGQELQEQLYFINFFECVPKRVLESQKF